MAMRWLWVAFLFAAAAAVPSGYAAAADGEGACPRAGTLGVSRTVEIDTTGGPGFGMEHYKAYDFLQPKEVVLTFDDGPQKYSTEAVLKALSDECVKATFFSIGKMALGYPGIIRDVAKAGHTIGTHTWSHKALGKLKKFDDAKDEIERGFSAVHRAVGGPIAPFFRFPTLVDTQETVAYLGKRNIAMFSCDIDSIDYKPQTAEHLVKSLMQKLDKRRQRHLVDARHPQDDRESRADAARRAQGQGLQNCAHDGEVAGHDGRRIRCRHRERCEGFAASRRGAADLEHRSYCRGRRAPAELRPRKTPRPPLPRRPQPRPQRLPFRQRRR